MPNLFRKLSSQNLGRPIRSLVFFILFYLYLWLEVDLRLIYHGGGEIINFPAFFRGWAFFQQFISYPSGLIEYLSAFLFQFLYIGWAGALVVTLLAWLIYVCTDAFIKAINSPRLRCVRFIGPILLLILHTQYTHYFVTTIALLAALVFVCLYLKITLKSRLLRFAVFLVLSVVLYYIAGGAYLLFAVLCAIYELLFRRCWQMGLLYLLSAAVIPYVEGTFVFGVNIIDAFSESLPFSWKILFHKTRRRMVTIVFILYLFLPLTALGLGLLRLFVRSLALPPDQPNASKATPDLIRWKEKVKKKPPSKYSKPIAAILSLYTGTPVLRWTIESLVLFVIAGAAVLFSYDNKIKTVLEIDYYACHKMWPQVLQVARRNRQTYFVIHAVNRALYHTGQLSSEMFSYKQYPYALFLNAKEHIFAYWKRFDICIDLGFISKAEHNLIESLEIFGERPIILKRLALINMVKADSGAARVYLGALSKTLFHADWANNYLSRLDSDPNLSTDDRIQQLRRIMVEKGYGGILSTLLAKNRQNRMAFEYSMAWYLLTRKLDKFVQNLDRLDDFDYPQIPRHYEEAILMYTSLSKKLVNLHGREISPQSRQRYKDFIQVYSFYRGNKQAAFKQLAKDYGDSYFFYYTYRLSGMKK